MTGGVSMVALMSPAGEICDPFLISRTLKMFSRLGPQSRSIESIELNKLQAKVKEVASSHSGSAILEMVITSVRSFSRTLHSRFGFLRPSAAWTGLNLFSKGQL